MFSILLGLVGGFPMVCSTNQLISLEKWFLFAITSPTVPKQQPAIEDKTHSRLGRESLWFRNDRFEPKITLLSVNRSTDRKFAILGSTRVEIQIFCFSINYILSTKRVLNFAAVWLHLNPFLGIRSEGSAVAIPNSKEPFAFPHTQNKAFLQ